MFFSLKVISSHLLVCLLAGLITLGAVALPAQAEVVEVQMLNNHPDNPRSRNLFLPRIVYIQPGDSVRFVASDLGHNAESIDGLVPDGFPKFKSTLSEDFELTFEEEGIFAYKCTPHYALGMVGLVVVGQPELDIERFKAKKMPRRAAKNFKKILKEFKQPKQ